MSAYFDEGFIDFFSGLALNNERSWFDVHRKEYKDKVKKPFDSFITDLLEEVRKFDDIDDLPTGKFQFRINRDIRFSKDKTPYTTWVSAAIVKEGKKDNRPGYYLRFSVDGVSLGGGMYHPEKNQLSSIRRSLATDSSGLHKLLANKKFTAMWGNKGLQGEKNKVLLKEFKEAAESEPLIFNKGFHYWQEYQIDEVLRDDLLIWVVKHFKAAKDVNAYLKKASGVS